jgi:DNA gyrase/topoisomerase IV subunit B
LVPDFDPPLPEDVIQKARNPAHAEGVKKKDREMVKKANKVQRKEEHEKCRKMQRQDGEEESSSINEGDYSYDWLDSMAE